MKRYWIVGSVLFAGAAIACTHMYAKKVIAVQVYGPAGASAQREAIALAVDAAVGRTELDVSWEEVRISGTYNNGPLDRPVTKLCGQTYGDAVRASPTSVSGSLGGGGAGAEDGGSTGTGGGGVVGGGFRSGWFCTTTPTSVHCEFRYY